MPSINTGGILFTNKVVVNLLFFGRRKCEEVLEWSFILMSGIQGSEIWTGGHKGFLEPPKSPSGCPSIPKISGSREIPSGWTPYQGDLFFCPPDKGGGQGGSTICIKSWCRKNVWL
jgi:hypothetical protein